MAKLTQARLKELLNYDPETGIFRWVEGHKYGGKLAGSLNGNGYLRIGIDWAEYTGHRLAFLYMTGSWPKGDIDHKDCVRSNNRWDNLRVATPSQNRANRASQSSVGLRGVYKCKKRFKAQLGYKIGNKSFCEYYGCFDTPAEAHEAFLKGLKARYGEFARGA